MTAPTPTPTPAAAAATQQPDLSVIAARLGSLEEAHFALLNASKPAVHKFEFSDDELEQLHSDLQMAQAYRAAAAVPRPPPPPPSYDTYKFGPRTALRAPAGRK